MLARVACFLRDWVLARLQSTPHAIKQPAQTNERALKHFGSTHPEQARLVQALTKTRTPDNPKPLTVLTPKPCTPALASQDKFKGESSGSFLLSGNINP